MSAHSIAPDLIDALKRLRLGRIAATLPERLVLADKQDMSFEELLLMILTDEIARRESTAADMSPRLTERFVLTNSPVDDRRASSSRSRAATT